MIFREYEEYNEIFVHNPNTKKMECVLSYIQRDIKVPRLRCWEGLAG